MKQKNQQVSFTAHESTQHEQFLRTLIIVKQKYLIMSVR